VFIQKICVVLIVAVAALRRAYGVAVAVAVAGRQPVFSLNFCKTANS
jgi:hypothetical protein